MSSTIRVQQLARKYKLSIDETIEKLEQLGISVNNKYSSVSKADEARFSEEQKRLRRKQLRETRKSGGAAVIRRKGPEARVRKAAKPKTKSTEKAKPVKKAAVRKKAKPEATPEKSSPETKETAKATTASGSTVKTEGKTAKSKVKKTVAKAKETKAATKSASKKKKADSTKTVKKKKAATKKATATPKKAVAETDKPTEPVKAAEELEEKKPETTETSKKDTTEQKAEQKGKAQKTAKKTSAKTAKVETTKNKTEERTEKRNVKAAADKNKVAAKNQEESAESKNIKEKNKKESDEKYFALGQRLNRAPLLSKPEASASPRNKAKIKNPLRKSNKAKKDLGPTGRFIVLPGNQSKSKSARKGSKSSKSKARKKDFRKGNAHKQQFQSYKEQKKEEELLRKAKRNKKKNKNKPTLPPVGQRKIKVDEFISVSELAKKMKLKVGMVIKKLLGLGQMVNINSTLDVDTAEIVASEWGFEIENITFEEEKFFQEEEEIDEEKLEKRLPVVTIMGHVDHGKTSLLDIFRKSDIASSESGGITQHIGAYRVKTETGEIVFIDTPGHEAFSSMRARGAIVTDIVVLVVAADDGVMPQTIEAINHCREADVPIIVAITKVDKENANTQMVKEKLTAQNLVSEDWGGETVIVETSAVTKGGIDDLLEMINLESELLDLKADPDGPAKGIVLEGELDKATGATVTVLIQNGRLKIGDYVISGICGGNVRSMRDDRGKQIEEAGPSSPVEVTGLNGVPSPGDDFRALTDEKKAKQILEKRNEQAKEKELARKSQAKGMEAIRLAIAKGEQEQLNIILKTDVQGTMEAIKDTMVNQSSQRVKVNVVHAGVGGITQTDVNLAITSGSVILGFRVRPASNARHMAENEGVEIKQYNVIYDMIEDVRDLMKGMLPKEKKEKQQGKAEVRQTFHIPKVGTIAGCYVLEGKVARNSHLRLYRDDVQIHEGKISSLRRIKDDVKQVQQGYECGIGFANYNDIKEGDQLEVYDLEEYTPELKFDD
ncbi:MAG: translation initiation factor IF-2 [Deltaproteobacteria bacterium]|nr:translation initiation factor IF-2 [Deltaproteobacteria bacterium]